MKIMIALILLVLLTGCGPYIFNLNGFILPDDAEFIETVKSLDTPYKTCAYMEEKFTPVERHFKAFSPYEMFKYRWGDCNDFCCFALFCARYHGYEVYEITLVFDDFSHIIAVYKIGNDYLVSDWDYLHEWTYHNFDEILNFFYGWNNCIIIEY
jgi:hypothetical protein